MLLALMRGAGVLGLGSMPMLEALGKGWLLRPLLSFTRAELEEWARAEGLQWLTDPSNDNLAFDRNFVRHRVVTSLRERWPAAARTASRSSQHLQEAWATLEQLAVIDAQDALSGELLNVERLATLNPERRRNLLRYWIRRRGARAPSTRKLAAIEHDMLNASVDRVPCMEWDGWEIRRHRGFLHCERQLPSLDSQQIIEWRIGAKLTLPAQLGQLRVQATQSHGLSAVKLTDKLTVRFRAGGESLQPAGDGMHRKLKKLLQAEAVLPWWRGRLPLIYSGEQLLAVGDLWIADEFAAREGEAAFTIVWDDKPHLHASSPTASRTD
jgi:tRNA(Ile)-lysidine synthase